MENFFLIVSYVLVAAFGSLLFYLGRPTQNRLTVGTVFCGYYLALAYLGSLPLHLQWSQRFVDFGITDPNVTTQLFLCTAVTFLLCSLGYFITRLVIPARLPIQGWFGTHEKSIANRKQLLVALGICLLVFGVYLSISREIPFLKALLGADYETIVKARSSATHQFSGPGKPQYYALFFSELLPFISFCLLSLALYRRTWSDLTWAALSIGSCALTSLIMTEKAPLVWYCFGLLIVYVASRPQTVRFSTLCLFGGAILLGAFLTVRLTSTMPTAYVLMSLPQILSERVFLSGIAPGYFYLSLFPAETPFLEGKSFPNPGGLFPFVPVGVAQTVWWYAFSPFMVRGLQGTAPTAFWAELYASFGVLGPLAFSTWVGIAVGLVDRFVFSLERSPTRAALLAWFSLYVMKLSETGISQYLVDYRPWCVLFVAVLISRPSFSLRRQLPGGITHGYA